jgi:hypothetical protein
MKLRLPRAIRRNSQTGTCMLAPHQSVGLAEGGDAPGDEGEQLHDDEAREEALPVVGDVHDLPFSERVILLTGVEPVLTGRSSEREL